MHEEEAGNAVCGRACFVLRMPVDITAGLIKKGLNMREWASLSAPGLADKVVDISLDKICIIPMGSLNVGHNSPWPCSHSVKGEKLALYTLCTKGSTVYWVR
jgi:hypothetical protein